MHSTHSRDGQLCFTAMWGIINVNHLEFFYMEVLSPLSHFLTYSIIYLYQYWLTDVYFILLLYYVYITYYLHMFIYLVFILWHIIYTLYILFIFISQLSPSIFILWHDKSRTGCLVIELPSNWLPFRFATANKMPYHNEDLLEKKFFFLLLGKGRRGELHAACLLFYTMRFPTFFPHYH